MKRPAIRFQIRLAGLALLVAGILCPPPARAQAELVFEAELCREMTSPWRPVEAEGASGGLALSLPEGAGSSEGFTQGREGRARFAVPGGDGGERELWLRLYWNGNCSNSLFVLCPPAERLLTVDSYSMRTWHWVKVPELSLPPGETEFDLINREDGIWVDQICVLLAGQPAPRGVRRALAAWPPPGPAVPAVSVVPAPGGPGIEALPPTEYLLHHARTPRLNLPRQPVLVVFPGQATPLDVWLRQNRPAGLPGTLRIGPAENLSVDPAAALALPLSAPLLECRRFTVRAHPSLPRGLTRLSCRVETADGLEQVREIRVLRPYRWLLSQPLRLNPAAGLDQLGATDAAVLADPLGTAHGITWHDAEPSQFTPFGLLDLRRAVSAEPFVQAYAFTRCSTVGGRAVLDLTHDDWIRVWLNGACVFSSTESAPSTLTRVRVPVTLRAGGNDVLVRCAQLKNYWEFGLVAESVAESPFPTPPEASAEAPVSAAAARVPEPLPRGSFESIVRDAPALVREAPPGQGWTVFAAACREAPLPRTDLWQRLSSSMQGLVRGPAERHRCAEALLELRRRLDLAILPAADRAALRSLTFRERAAFLVPGFPLEAAEENLLAACWTDSRAEQQALHVEVVRLLLCGDGADEAAAYLAVVAADLADAEQLRGVIALYRGDLAEAAACFPGVRPAAADRYAGWLLSLGRAAEAEWLLRRVPAPSVWNLLAQATACVDQRRFAEGEALLLECLRRDDAPRSGWETAATELAKFHAARCSLPEASARLRAEADALSHHAAGRRARLLQALWRLDQEAHDPVQALRDALDEADLTAGSYRPPARQDLEALLRPALAGLLDEKRYAEAIDLCNQALAVAPGLRLQADVHRLVALQGLGRPAAAAAVLERLLLATATGPVQARRVLSLLTVSAPAANAAERLAQVVLDRPADDRALSADVVLAQAYASAVLGQYDRTAGELERALALAATTGRSPEFQTAQARFWIAQCVDLAHDNPLLITALLGSAVDSVRQATLAVLRRRGSSAAAELLAQAHDLDSPRAVAALESALRSSAADDEEAEADAPEGPQILPVLSRMLADGLVDQIAMESGDPPCIWIVEHGRFPFCVELGAADVLTRFESALRPFGDPLPVGRMVIFLHGLVWVGTDRGLFCYHRDAAAWDRLRLPGAALATPVAALAAVDGRLQVTWTAAPGRQIQGTFSLDSRLWETAAAP